MRCVNHPRRYELLPPTEAFQPRMGMLTEVMKLSLEGKTVDAVQHILAIAERERRKRALKEASGQLPSLSTPLGKDQDPRLEKGK